MADTSAVFKQVADILDEVAQKLKVECVLITRNTPTHLRIEGTSGPAEKIYTVGAQQRKGSIFEEQHELYCEHLLNKNLPYLFVRDSRVDPVWDGNEDQVVFGLVNYFGYPIRDGRGSLYGTICVLHTEPRDYSDEDKTALQQLQQAVENALKFKSRVKTLAPVAESKIVQPLQQITSTSLKAEPILQPAKVAARA